MSSREFLSDEFEITENHLAEYDTSQFSAQNHSFGVENISLNSEPQQNAFSRPNMPINEPTVDESATLDLYFYGKASLRELQNNEELAHMKLVSQGSADQYAKLQTLMKSNSRVDSAPKPGVGNIGSPLTPKVNQSMELPKILVTKVTLMGLKSTFDCGVGLQLTGVAGNKMNALTSFGKLVNYMAFPKAKVGKPVVLMNAPQNENIEFIKKFPRWTIDNIHEGITRVPGESFALVKEDHPVLFFIRSGCKTETELAQFEGSKVGNQSYKLQTENVDLVMEFLKQDMSDGMPLTSPEQIGLKMVRGFAPENPNVGKQNWTDDNEIFDGINKDRPGVKDGVLDKVNKMYCHVQLRYRLA